MPKEELYKRVAGAYLDYDVKLYWMIDDYKFKTYGSFWHSRYEVAYYELENINLSNCFEVLEKPRGKNDRADTDERVKG